MENMVTATSTGDRNNYYKEKIKLLKEEKNRLKWLVEYKNACIETTKEKYDICKQDKHNISNLLDCKKEEIDSLKTHLEEKHNDSDNYRRR